MRFVSVNFLKEGQILGRDIVNEKGMCFLKEGKMLTEKYISSLKNLGYIGVYINDKISEDLKIEDAINQEVRQKAIFTISETFQKIKKQKYIDIEEIKKEVLNIVDEVLSNKSIAINLLDLKNYNNYTFQHSVNVAIYSLIIGKELGYDRIKLEKLGKAGILHDIGKVFVDEKILNKKGKLTDEEFEKVKQHSKLGYEFLKKSVPHLEHTVFSGILQHHEKYDGTGYPFGLSGEKIYEFARIIAIADVYDALTSNRPYKDALPPSEALEVLYGGSGTHFDPHLLSIFSKKMFPYPIGTLVKLNDNDTYIVIENKENFNSRPIVRNIKTNKIIDLSIELNKIIIDIAKEPLT